MVPIRKSVGVVESLRMSRQTRRMFLTTAGALGVAGCMTSGGQGNSDPENGTPSDNESTTTTTTSGGASGGSLPGDQFDGFEKLERWYAINQHGSVSAGKDAYEGSQSMHLKSDGKYVGAFKAFSAPKDMSGKNVSLALKVKSPQRLKINVELLAPDRGNKLVLSRTMPGPTEKWMRIDMGAANEVRSPDLSSVQEIRIIARDHGGIGKPFDLFVDDFRLMSPPDKGRVMLTFDNVWKSHYTTAFPMMQDLGFKGVEGVVSDAVYGKERLDVGMMREMRDAGWDMASLPPSKQYLTKLSPKKQRETIEKNKQFLVRKGFEDGARHMFTPSRRRGPKTMEIVNELHETMFTFGGASNALPSTTQYNYGRINTRNSAAVKNLVDLTAKHKQLLVCNIEDVGTGSSASMTEKDLEAFLKYVKQANVEVVTASQLLEQQG
jgi:hypothetical protein